MNRRWIVPLLATAATACATPRPRWVESGKQDDSQDRPFHVQVPPGWMSLSSEASVVMTRDGPLLQRIVVTRSEIGKPLANTKKVLAADMAAQEAAEVVADDLSSSQALAGAKVVENVPATVGAIPGFRLTLAYKDRGGLRYRLAVYGAIAGRWLYRLTYVAPERHYFELDRATFEDVARSFRPGPDAPGSPRT